MNQTNDHENASGRNRMRTGLGRGVLSLAALAATGLWSGCNERDLLQATARIVPVAWSMTDVRALESSRDILPEPKDYAINDRAAYADQVVAVDLDQPCIGPEVLMFSLDD
jgi:hypothetical protein